MTYHFPDAYAGSNTKIRDTLNSAPHPGWLALGRKRAHHALTCALMCCAQTSF